jgi:hypothetical protein
MSKPAPAAKEELSPVDAARKWVAELERRQNCNEFLVQPPKPLSVLNGPEPLTAETIRAVGTWLEKTAKAGGPQDIIRAWSRWVPFDHRLRHMLRGTYDRLLQVGIERELRARGIVSVADSVLGAQQAQKQRAEAERAAIAKERAKLEAREAALNQLEEARA